MTVIDDKIPLLQNTNVLLNYLVGDPPVFMQMKGLAK